MNSSKLKVVESQLALETVRYNRAKELFLEHFTVNPAEYAVSNYSANLVKAGKTVATLENLTDALRSDTGPNDLSDKEVIAYHIRCIERDVFRYVGAAGSRNTSTADNFKAELESAAYVDLLKFLREIAK